MFKRINPIKVVLAAGVIALGVGISACSDSNDDGDAGDDIVTDGDDTDGDDTDGDDTSAATDIRSLTVLLDSAQEVPPVTVPADNASGTADISVDVVTGAVTGMLVVSGTTGTPTMAHIHQGAVGEAGPILIGLDGSEDGNTWTVPEGATLDAAGIEAFEMGNLYFNVHTEANMPGEIRGQIVEAAAPAAGSLTVSFTNIATDQLITPPVVILHNAPDSDNPIRAFQVGAPVSAEVRDIAENGMNGPLVMAFNGQIPTGRVSAVAVAPVDPAAPGPIMPGQTSSVTVDVETPDQVLSIVTMIICTNDGFSGLDSRPVSEIGDDETFTLPIYDAGSEGNILTLDYWVPPCGTPENIQGNGAEGGVIRAHPGQSGSEVARWDFAPGSEFVEVNIVRN